MEKLHSHYKLGFFATLASFILSFGYIYAMSSEFWESLTASLLTAGLVCATYYILYWVLMAFKR